MGTKKLDRMFVCLKTNRISMDKNEKTKQENRSRKNISFRSNAGFKLNQEFLFSFLKGNNAFRADFNIFTAVVQVEFLFKSSLFN